MSAKPLPPPGRIERNGQFRPDVADGASREDRLEHGLRRAIDVLRAAGAQVTARELEELL